MRKFKAVFFLLVCACVSRAASFTNGQAARASLGQLEFTFAATASSGASNILLGGPSGLAWWNGTLWVADSNRVGATATGGVQNNRVVSFNTNEIPSSYADLTTITPPSPYCGLCGFAQVNVLGEPDFVSQGPQARSSQSMTTPTAVATDGHIFAVADTDNNRVLIWKEIPTSIDQPADLVLGQASFTSFQSPQPINSNSLRGPQGVWIQNGKLFVADTQNYRVLIWNSIPTTNNQPADLVLGQPNFNVANAPPVTSSTPVAAANALLNPVAVTSDGTHLFVADLGFNRVLIWNEIPTTMDQSADVVIGQPNMTATTANNSSGVCASNGTSNGSPTYPAECAATLNYPRYALSDGTRLFVADGGNDRVLIFNTIPTTNGKAADAELGQPDFGTDIETSGSITITSTAIDSTAAVDLIPSPMSLAWDGTNLYVSDPYNRRVEVFTQGDTSLPSNSAVNWASEVIRQEGVVTMSLPSGGAIVANDTVTISIQSTNYTYTIKKTDTLDTIAQGLVGVINAGSGDPNATAIFGGTGTASVYLSSKGADLAYDSITLSATTSNTADIVATASGAYLTAGTAGTGAALMLVEINGTNLADATTPIPAPMTGGNLPTTFGGVQVYMDGVATPIWSVSSTQVIAQIPYSFTNGTAALGSVGTQTASDRNSTSIYVRTVHGDGGMTVTNATPMYIAPANPGLFNQPSYSGEPRPWPAVGALHQPGNPTAVVSIDGSITAGNTATITIAGNSYTYTVQSSDTLASVAQDFVNLINGKPDPNVTASLGAAFDRVILTAIKSGAAGTGISIGGSTSTGADITITPYTSSTCCNVTPGSLITPKNPAVPGELITLSATGLGILDDVNGNRIRNYTEGQPYAGPQPNTASNSVNTTMGGSTAETINAGLAPGSYGIYQVQVVVPSGLSTSTLTQTYIAQNAFISNIVTLPVGPAVQVPGLAAPPPISTSPIRMFIDSPASQSTVSGPITASGWAIDLGAAINTVIVSIDGISQGAATYGISRPDVCAIYTGVPGCTGSSAVGWNFALDTTTLSNGGHTISITATGADGQQLTEAQSFTVSNSTAGNPTVMFIDRPGPSSSAYQGWATFSGWAINQYTSISSVTASVDGVPVGTANYGTNRPDVCAAYPGSAGCPNVGWSILVNTGNFTNGSHTLSVVATAANGQHTQMSSSFTVSNFSNNNPTLIDIDVPNSSSGPFNGTNVTFGGWAINNNSAVSAVMVSIDGVPYGNATYGVARPDVCNVYPGRAGCPNVGWSYTLDTTLLSDGNHTLALTALMESGQQSTTSTKFSVSNFGSGNPMKLYVDSPNSQTGALSGTATVQGWAISSSSSISTVKVLVDGVSYGTATPVARPDVCAAYPGTAGCPNVGWTFSLDTTMLTNGGHTLEITATAASGQHGTTSTAFTVANSTSSGPMRVFIDQPNAQSNPFTGSANFSGWAINDVAAIASVNISIDGVPAGSANYGVARPDVCGAYPGRLGCPNVGWSYVVDTTTLTNGTHTLGATAVTTGGALGTANSTFRVSNWSTTNPMTIYIDTPSNATGWLQGSVSVHGWAVDSNGPIATVTISVDGAPVGVATYGTSRPDVCNASPGYAGCPNVGWTYTLDTTQLPDGLHTLGVAATSTSGQSSITTQIFGTAN